MKYEATISFVGEVCMVKGEVMELESSIAKPLVSCGYLIPTRKVEKNESKRNNKRSDSESS